MSVYSVPLCLCVEVTMARSGHFSGAPKMTRSGEAAAIPPCYFERMTNTSFAPTTNPTAGATNARANALADRLEAGARALIAFAASLTDAEWRTRTPKDGRTIGVTVHHVAAVYPIEIQLAQTVAEGKPVTGLTMDDIHAMNAQHAQENSAATKEEALELLRRNSAAAASAIRALSDEELDRSVPVSLYSDATLTCQFVLEDHAVRHSYHHLARLRTALRS